jgi:hypothetical protein
VTVLPAVIVVLAICLGALGVVGQQLRLVDAAAVAARAAGRGETAAAAAGLASGLVPGVRIAVEQSGQIVCVRASSTVHLVGSWPISARSCAAAGGR